MRKYPGLFSQIQKQGRFAGSFSLIDKKIDFTRGSSETRRDVFILKDKILSFVK